MEMWNKIRYLLKQCIILPLFVIPIGWIYTKIKYPLVQGRMYVVIYQGIGDIIVSMGYLDAYLEKYKGQCKEVYLIQIERNKQIYQMYTSEGKSYHYKNVFISKKEYMWFCLFHETSFGFKCINARKDFIFLHTYNFIKDNWNYFYRMPGMNFMNFIKIGIYALDDDADFVEPKAPEIAEEKQKTLLEQYDLNNKKAIVLNPYANTIMGKIKPAFWVSLAERLIKEGYEVYTDCGVGDKEPVIGTKEMVVSLAELSYICRYVSGYIGLRSGLLDYLLFSKCKIFAIYPGEIGCDGNEVFQAFDINGINQLVKEPINENCWQYEVKDEKQVIDSIIDKLKGTI